jgi:hypothetical protein
MASRKLSAAIAVAGIALAVVLFVVLQDDDSSDPKTPLATTITESGDRPRGQGRQDREAPTVEEEPPAKPAPVTIVVRDGKPLTDVVELEVTKGDRIRFLVESDVAEEVHLHGYDIAKEVEAGGRVEFNVPATIEGVFEVELERSSVPLAEISVTPA